MPHLTRSTRLALLAAVLLIALPAAADANPFYLVGKLGNTDTDAELGDSFRQIVAGDDTSSGIGLGVRFGRHFAIQAEYLDLGVVPGAGSLCGPSDQPCLALVVPVVADSTAISVTLLPHLEVSRRLSLYGKLGFVSWDSDVSQLDEAGKRFIDEFKDEELVYGAGLRFELPGPIDLFGEYERIGDLFDSVSLGATLGF